MTMTALPISTNALPAANAAANSPLGALADLADPAAGGAFASLLANRFGDAAMLTEEIATRLGIKLDPQTLADGTAGLTDPALLKAANAPADPSALLANILAQLPGMQQAQGGADATGLPQTARKGGVIATEKGVIALHGKAAQLPADAQTAAAAASGQTDSKQIAQLVPGAVPQAAEPFAGRLQAAAASQNQGATPSAEIMKTVDLAPAAPATPNPAAQLATLTPNTASAATQPLQQTIQTPVNQPGWGEEFAQKINWISTQKNQVAELHLNPPDLGPLDVVLKVTDNQATALFSSPHGAVREAIESALPRLRESLADSGITLGQATVSDQAPQDRGQQERQHTAGGRGLETGGESGADTALASVSGSVTTAVPRHNGLFDTFA